MTARQRCVQAGELLKLLEAHYLDDAIVYWQLVRQAREIFFIASCSEGAAEDRLFAARCEQALMNARAFTNEDSNDNDHSATKN